MDNVVEFKCNKEVIEAYLADLEIIETVLLRNGEFDAHDALRDFRLLIEAKKGLKPNGTCTI